jgi:hypothetical protein
MADRVRGALFEIRGVRMGPKTWVGPTLRIIRPRCVRLGSRWEIEQNVFLNSVDDDARLVISDELGDFGRRNGN